MKLNVIQITLIKKSLMKAAGGKIDESKNLVVLGSMVGIIAAFLILLLLIYGHCGSISFVRIPNFMSILKQTPFNALLAIGMLFIPSSGY